MLIENAEDLLIARFDSLGDLLKALNELPVGGPGRLCEQIRYGGVSDLLLSGNKENIQPWILHLSSRPQFKIIEKYHNNLMNCFFHLENKAITDSVAVVETQSLMHLMVCLDDALKSSLELVEMNVPRYQNAMLSVIITGQQKEVCSFYNRHKDLREIKIVYIESVNKSLARCY